MRIDRITHEAGGREPEDAWVAVGDAPGRPPLQLSAHRDLLRVFHGGQAMRAGPAAGRATSSVARRAIRERLLDGSYRAPPVIDELARRLLASADL